MVITLVSWQSVRVDGCIWIASAIIRVQAVSPVLMSDFSEATEPEPFNFGIAARNLGSAIGDDTVPMIIAGGLAYRVLHKHVATFSVDVQHQMLEIDESTTSVHLGTEYLIAKTFAIRGGSKLTEDRVQFFGGFGVNVGGLQLDYALKAVDSAVHNEVGSGTHFVSLSYSY